MAGSRLKTIHFMQSFCGLSLRLFPSSLPVLSFYYQPIDYLEPIKSSQGCDVKWRNIGFNVKSEGFYKLQFMYLAHHGAAMEIACWFWDTEWEPTWHSREGFGCSNLWRGKTFVGFGGRKVGDILQIFSAFEVVQHLIRMLAREETWKV